MCEFCLGLDEVLDRLILGIMKHFLEHFVNEVELFFLLVLIKLNEVILELSSFLFIYNVNQNFGHSCSREWVFAGEQGNI